MAGWRHEVSAVVVTSRILHGEAEGVVDGAGGNFVVAHQPWEDGQPSGIRRGPAPGPLLIILQVPNRLRIGAIGSVAAHGAEGFIQHAGVAVQYQNVLVTRVVIAICGEPLDGRVGREWGAGNIALAGVCIYGYGHQWLSARVDHDIWNAVVSACH